MPVVIRLGLVQGLSDALGDERQHRLLFEVVAWSTERVVEARDQPSEGRVVDGRSVDGGSDEVVADPARLDVQHTLVEASSGGGRPAVVSDEGWQHGDPAGVGGPVVLVEVVAHGPGVDHQHCPGVVAVTWVGVLGEAGVEDLSDAGQVWSP